MKKFWKEVIRPGVYHHKDKYGNDTTTTITKDRIDHWHSQNKKMFDVGLQIPLPYFHTDKAQPILKDKIPDDVRNNAGYLVDSKVEEDGGLWMQVDPTESEDEINKKIRHVSIRTDNFKDGQGNMFADAITHVAATNNGVMQDQKPFVPEHGLALSLSMATDSYMSGYTGSDKQAEGTSLESAVTLLSELGIELGGDTTPENFLDRLCTALRTAKAIQEKEEGELGSEQMPEGAKTQKPAPIAMSQSLLEFSLSKVAAEPENPNTGKAWKPEELEAAYDVYKAAQPKLEFSQAQQAAFDQLQKNNKLAVRDRIKACTDSHLMAKDTGEALVGRLNDVTLQFSLDGSIDEEHDSYRGIFDAIKFAEAGRKGAGLHGTDKLPKEDRLTLEDRPVEFSQDPDDEDIDELAKKMAAMVG